MLKCWLEKANVQGNVVLSATKEKENKHFFPNNLLK